MLMVSGMVRQSRYPLTAQTNASPIPVLPLVGSTIKVCCIDQALPLCLGNHVGGDAILNTAQGVIDTPVWPQFRPVLRVSILFKPHQRRSTDGGTDIAV